MENTQEKLSFQEQIENALAGWQIEQIEPETWDIVLAGEIIRRTSWTLEDTLHALLNHRDFLEKLLHYWFAQEAHETHSLNEKLSRRRDP